jgi:hypothetical protein
MSIYRLVQIECDGLGCNAVFDTTTDDFDQAVDTAAKQGWTRDDDTDEDFCPDHKGA